MKLAPDVVETSEEEADPDTAPANWNHPYFWAGFAIHGTKDTITV